MKKSRWKATYLVVYRWLGDNMFNGNFFITPHAARKYAEIRGIDEDEARWHLVEISLTAKFIKVLPSKFLLYRYHYSRSQSAMNARKSQGLRRSKRSHLDLVIAPAPDAGKQPILVTVLWRNPYAKSKDISNNG